MILFFALPVQTKKYIFYRIFFNGPTFHCATYGDIFFENPTIRCGENANGPRGPPPYTPMGWLLTKIKIYTYTHTHTPKNSIGPLLGTKDTWNFEE